MEFGKLYATGNSIVVAIAAPLLSKLGWKRGDRVLMDIRDEALIMTRVEAALAVDDKPVSRRPRKSTQRPKRS